MPVSRDLRVGRSTWTLTFDQARTIEFLPRLAPMEQTASTQQLVSDSLESPFGFDSPMRRAVTPEDRVVIVLDESLPEIATLLTGVLDHLVSGGVKPTSITVLVPHTSKENAWLDDLPDRHEEITLEVHDPEDRNKLAYLAASKSGDPIYLNRSLVNAEFVVVITGRRFAPTHSYAGAESAVYPGFSDAETMAKFVGDFTIESPSAEADPRQNLAAEVLWLLGTPFLVQVIEGGDDRVAEVVAGLPDSLEEGTRRQNIHWRRSISERPELVVATISSLPERVSFTDMAMALATAARVVHPEGRIALLCDAAPPLEEGAEILQQNEDLDDAHDRFKKRKPDDWPGAGLWAFAAEQASLFVAAGWDDETIESLHATTIRKPAEVQRLIDVAPQVLLIPDAHLMVVDVQ